MEMDKYRTINLLNKLWKNISRIRKLQLIFLFFLMILSGVAEAFSLASILPFLSIITNPKAALNNQIIFKISNFLGVQSADNLITYVTIIFCAAVLLSSIIRLLNIWLNNKVSASIGSELSFKAYKNIIFKPYKLHTLTNSSEVITASITQLNQTVAVINQTLQFFTSLVVGLSLLLAIFFINFKKYTLNFFLYYKRYQY